MIGCSRDILAVGVVAVAFAACDDGVGPPAPPPPATVASLEVVSGEGQTGAAAAVLPAFVVVRALDADGEPVPELELSFTTSDGSVEPARATTGADGGASVAWRLAPRVGEHALTVAVAGGPSTSVAATATVPPQAALRVGSGGGQIGTVGEMLPADLVAFLRLPDSTGIAGARVEWNPAAGSGAAEPVSVVTDSAGRASARWRLGSAVGEQTLAARVDGGWEVEFTAMATAGDATRVVIDPAAAVLASGDTIRLRVVASDSLGNALPADRVIWASADTTVVTVEAGLVRAVTHGETSVFAAAGHVADTATVLVTGESEAQLELVSGDQQVGYIGSGLPQEIVVRTSFPSGASAPGVRVAFSVVVGGGSFEPAVATSDADGLARARWRLGGRLDTTHVARAQITTSAHVTVSAFPVLAPDVRVVAESGDSQSAAAGGGFPQPLVARVTLPDGEPVRGATVRWTSAAPSALTPGVSTTDGAGRVSTRWTPPTVAGLYEARAMANDTALFVGSVVPSAAVELRLDPASARLRVGERLSLEPTIVDAYGNRIDEPPNFASTDTSVATVDVGGVVFARHPGTAHVTARSGAAADTASLDVLQAVAAEELVYASANGELHTCGVTAIGDAFCWGANHRDQLGVDAVPDECSGVPCTFEPVRVPVEVEFDTVAIGWNHSCGLATDGDVWCWGSDEVGQLGSRSSGPVLDGAIDFAALAVGYRHTCAVDQEGTAYCWGSNGSGQLGVDRLERCPPNEFCGGPSPVPGRRFRSVTAGRYHTCGIAVDGDTYCWGQRIPHGESNHYQYKVVTESEFEAVVAGAGRHVCGLTAQGAVYCWGDNTHGQLGGTGDCEGSCSFHPVRVPGPPFTQLSVGWDRSCALTADGTTYCWGKGYGQLPVQLDRRYESYSAGSNHSCGRALDGKIYCTGDNSAGQLGTRTPGAPVSEPEP